MYTRVMIELTVKIYGRVQGVFFRQSTKEEAMRLGVCGWVKNCSDGSVAVLIQGDASVMDQMMAWLSIGPEMAQVREVKILSQKDCTKLKEGFTILYE